MNYTNYNVNLNSKAGEINNLKLQIRDLLFQELSINEMIIRILSNLTDTETLLILANFPDELRRVCYDENVYRNITNLIELAKNDVNQP